MNISIALECTYICAYKASICFVNGLSTLKRATHSIVPSAAIALVLGTVSWSSAAAAADADWGCQVLLCAASQNPGWQGVPYCVPPMQRLIATMSLPFFSWPICAVAGSGAPGYERYEDCPSGYTPSRSSDGSAYEKQSDFDRCSRPAINQTCFFRSSSNPVCSQVEVIDRPLRAKPYYFDIPQASGQSERVWFSLQE